jgi:hypothetical protein
MGEVSEDVGREEVSERIRPDEAMSTGGTALAVY